MILLIALACLAGVLRAFRAAPTRARPALWPAVAAALTLLTLWLGSADIARYRFTLLGLRFRVATEAGTPIDAELRIGGDYASADLFVAGAGDADAAVLRVVGDTAVREVAATAVPDARAVVLIEHERLLGGDRLEVLGAVPLDEGDTIRIIGRGGVHRLVVGTVPDSISIAGARIGLPWVRRHTFTDVARAGARPIGLPGVERSWLAQWIERRPTVRQRTYPLADVLAQDADAEGVADAPALSSFLFYDEGRLALADLDSEVDVAGRASGSAAVWSRADGGLRIIVAGLPLRDYPDPDLTLPERYGVRPLRSFRFSLHDGWLDAALTSPEIRVLDRAALDEILAGTPPTGTDASYSRVRLSTATNTRVREAIAFGVPSRRFAAAGQAVFLLPTRPSEVGYHVLTPSGTAEWRTGRPIAVGDAERAILLRVDGQAAAGAFWAVHLIALALAVAVFRFVPTTTRVRALATAAYGILLIRLLLGISGHLAYPYVQESQQLGIWLLPFVPWTIVAAGRVGARALPGAPHATRWGAHVCIAFALVTLASILFVNAPAKQAVLSTLPVLVLVALLAPDGWGARAVGATRGRARAASGRAAAAIGRIGERLPRVVRGGDAAANGVLLGTAFLLVRVVLDLLGAREQVVLAGTRLGLSVIYTPLSLLALAVLMHRRARRLANVRDPVAGRREAAHALLHIGAYLLIAFVLVGFWISDFGIVFTTLPGALVLLAMFAARAVPRTPYGRITLVAAILPLIVFTLIHAAPTLLHPGLGGDIGRVEARMGEWNRNELLLLERGDPQALEWIGQRRSEALAVMGETMRSYTRGNWSGMGFLHGRVTTEVRSTATREHTVSALLAAQWGLFGVIGLVLLLLAALVPVTGLLPGGGRGREHARWVFRTLVPCTLGLLALAVLLPAPHDFLSVWAVFLAIEATVLAPAFGLDPARWGGRIQPGADGANPLGETTASMPATLRLSTLIAALFLVTFTFAGLYMVLANYGVVLFTGKNVYLLGLDSVSDALEALALLCGAAAALAAADRGLAPGAPDRVAVPERKREEVHA